jgi:hypothetical protein
VAGINRESFELPKDPEVKIAAGIVLASLVFLIFVSRVFRDVNAS